MKEWLVFYILEQSEDYLGDGLVSFRSSWRLLFWLVRNLRRCAYIRIARPATTNQPLSSQSPCDTCLRWEECNGVDIDFCAN